MFDNDDEFRPIAEKALRLIAEAKAKRVALLGNSIPEDWGEAVQQAYPDVWAYWPAVPGGWIDVCMALSEHLGEAAPGAQVWDSKEKFGGLRTSITGDTEMPVVAFDISHVYEVLSTTVCQDCGEPGRMRHDGGWDATLCDKHAENRDMR